MMPDLNDIFSEDEDMLSDDELLKYLDEKTPEEEKHALEKKMPSSAFENEAIEGLQKFRNKQKLDDYVKQLNKNLHQQIAARKQAKRSRKIKELPMIILVVVIILAICILGYIVIHLYQKNISNNRQQTSYIHPSQHR
jgi:hypothetical protein